jgi:hypothetical protein
MDDQVSIHAIDVRVARLEEQHKGAKEAQNLIAISLADYKTTANEWRGTVQDITGKCITRLEAQALFDRMADKIERLEKSKNEQAGKSAGAGASWGVVISVGMFLLGLVTVVVLLWKH